MSLLPLILNIDDALHDLFSYGLYPGIERPRMLRKPRHAEPWNNSNLGTAAHIGTNGFHVLIDVQHFRPNEISVNTVQNTVIVEGKHEENEDGQGNIYRHFVRRFQLPNEIDISGVESTLSADGLLTIKAPSKKVTNNSNERMIEIQHQTGPAFLPTHTNKHNI